jgi:hypothetical protein
MAPVAAEAWLRVEVRVGMAPSDDRASVVDGHRADLRLLGGGRLCMSAAGGRAEFTFARRPDDAELLHPYLAPAAALVQIWAGAEALHAGALATPAGAVLLIGGKESGKSTTLAWLAAERGVAVVADDLAVVAGGAVLPGPRCLDVRRSDAYDPAALAGSQLVRGGSRVRVPLAAVAAAAAVLPLAGVVVLGWGDSVRVSRLPPRERLGALLAQRMFTSQLPADLPAILDLAALPLVRLSRPPGLAGLAGAGDALLAYFAG